MSDPKNFDWSEAIEDAQRLDMLRLQREQTDLLKEMSTKSGSQRPMMPLEIKLGLRYSDNPEEFKRRLKEWQAEGRRKTMKFLVYPLLGVMLLLFVVMFIKLSIEP